MALCLVFIGVVLWVHVDVRFKDSLGLPANEQSREWLKFGLLKHPYMKEAAINENTYAPTRKRGDLVLVNFDSDHDLVRLIWSKEPIFASEIGSFHRVRRVCEVNFCGLESQWKTRFVEYFYFNEKVVSSPFERGYLAFPIYDLNPLLHRSRLQVDLLLDSQQGFKSHSPGPSSSEEKEPIWNVCRGEQFAPWIAGRLLLGASCLFGGSFLYLNIAKARWGQIWSLIVFALGWLFLLAPVPWDLGPCPAAQPDDQQTEYRQTFQHDGGNVPHWSQMGVQND